MTWGLSGAFAAALAYGVATVLQATGARQTGRSAAPDAHLLWQLVHSMPYVAGLLLDGVGFALSLAALRTEPLFTVQAIVASSLAVTALLAVAVLGARPSIIEWAALVFVTSGLVLLALSATSQKPAHIDYGGRAGLLAGVVVVGGAAALIARRTGERAGRRRDTWALGCLAGLMYGAGAIGARVLANPTSIGSLLVDPALWAMLFAGILGLLLYAMALQRGTVTLATSAVVATETLVPAALGITFLGDRTARGDGALAAAGFAITVAGSLMLARYGEAPSTAPATDPQAADDTKPVDDTKRDHGVRARFSS